MTTMKEINIRAAKDADAAGISQIYNFYVAETIVTFEEAPVDVSQMKQRLRETENAKLPWLVCEKGDEILGFAYASRWKGRCAYRHTVESTIYLSPKATGKGVGSLLLCELLTTLNSQSFHTVIGGISLPNDASIALHQKLGFEKVAHFKQVGNKFNHWIDVGYWQLNLSNAQLDNHI